MAGIGIQLNKIFKKKSVLNLLRGVGYSTAVTIAPMLVIIINIILLYNILDLDLRSFYERELLSCSLLYVFIFSCLSVSIFDAVISRYLSDKIFEKKSEDIIPCFYTGLLMNIALAAMLAIPFVLHEIFVGKVCPIFAFTTFCMFMSLTIVFYTMQFLSLTKDYKIISILFFIGMLVAFVLSILLVWIFRVSVIYAIQYGMTAGFLVTALTEFAYVRRYFTENSGNYGGLLPYFKRYFMLVVTNFGYTLGLYIHNFIFWTTPNHLIVANSFICHQPYDLATCIAMFTNISATVIFIVQVETRFHERYQKYSEAVIGGKLKDIDKAKSRMFRMLSEELTNLIHVQFIISVGFFLLFYIFLPNFGLSGLVMDIYPSVAAAYYVIFIVRNLIIFLYYLNDLPGAAMTSLVFLFVTAAGTFLSIRLPESWWGLGVFLGAFSSWVVGYFRIRYIEKHFDAHIFCCGSLIKKVYTPLPPPTIDIAEHKHVS